MESNLLINHPASLDTVTALKRDSDACISTSAHQSASACGSTEALRTIYQYTRRCRTCLWLWFTGKTNHVYICGSGSSYLQVGCWDGSWRVIILVTTSARSRFPGLSNHLCIAHLFGFLALDAIASLREYTIIFHLYFRSQIPRVAHRCALELIFGSAARFSAPGWIFPHPPETSGKPTYHQ